jgi:hypothetical protein
MLVRTFKPEKPNMSTEGRKELYAESLTTFCRELKWNFDSSRYRLFLYDSLFPGEPSRAILPPPSPGTIIDLCKANLQNYMLTLDDYEFGFSQDVETEVNDDGTKEKTAHYTLWLNARLTLYGSGGEHIRKITVNRTKPYQSRMVLSGLLAVGPAITKAVDEISEGSSLMAADVLGHFYPGIGGTPRDFYIKGELLQAYHAFLDRNWETVEYILLILAESDDSSIAGMAAHNLSVLYEQLRREEEREHWQAIALEKLGAKTR